MTNKPSLGKELSSDHSFMGKPRMCSRCGEHEEGLLVGKGRCPQSTAACYHSHTFPLPRTDDSTCLSCGVAWSISETVMCKSEEPPGPHKITIGDDEPGSFTFDPSKLIVVEGVEIRPKHRIQIVVLHNDETYTYHPVPPGQGWKMVNPGLLLIGKGLGRVHVPLIGVRYFMPEAY